MLPTSDDLPICDTGQVAGSPTPDGVRALNVLYRRFSATTQLRRPAGAIGKRDGVRRSFSQRTSPKNNRLIRED